MAVTMAGYPNVQFRSPEYDTKHIRIKIDIACTCNNTRRCQDSACDTNLHLTYPVNLYLYMIYAAIHRIASIYVNEEAHVTENP